MRFETLGRTGIALAVALMAAVIGYSLMTGHVGSPF
jgi:hypothetical protein